MKMRLICVTLAFGMLCAPAMARQSDAGDAPGTRFNFNRDHGMVQNDGEFPRGKSGMAQQMDTRQTPGYEPRHADQYICNGSCGCGGGVTKNRKP